MFALLIVTGQVSAELDAAAGYTSIYGDSGSSQALSSISVPSVPWGSHAADHGNTFTPNASWCGPARGTARRAHARVRE